MSSASNQGNSSSVSLFYFLIIKNEKPSIIISEQNAKLWSLQITTTAQIPLGNK